METLKKLLEAEGSPAEVKRSLYDVAALSTIRSVKTIRPAAALTRFPVSDESAGLNSRPDEEEY